MEVAVEKTAQGLKVGVMFGPEAAGLENDDIARANATITVPVNPKFPSLNLAQCVLLTGYEWRRQTTRVESLTHEMVKTDWAPHIEVERLADHFEQQLDTAGFFFPHAKAQSMKTNLRNMWSRMALTRADVQALHGMLRQLVWTKNTSDR
jgi:tRNA/rRNA methyltransferase